jgi:tetratricopeptide (TPR) repeat protein
MDLNEVLIEAAKDGNMLVLKTALEKGADINAKDNSGMTALMYAEQRGYTEIVNFLKEKGAISSETIKSNIAAKEEELFNEAISHFKSGEYEKVIEKFTEVIKLDPNYAYAYNNRGSAYDKLGEYQKAIDDYTRVIGIDPNIAVAYYNRGLTYYKLGEYRKAIDDYTRAIGIDPNYAYAYNSRGLTYYKLGEYQKAIDDYTRAIGIDPNYADAYYNRGLTYDELGEHQKAINDFCDAGILYLKQNNKTQALECVDCIRKVDPYSSLIDKLQDLIDQT